MPDASFDIVIVGTDIGGLALGAQCARQGYTVLLIGHDGKPNQYTLDKHPMLRELPLLYGFSSSPVIRSLFRDIGLIAEMRNKPIPFTPPIQVVTPGHRYDISLDADQTQAELRREFGDDGRNIERFWRSATGLNNELGEALGDLPLLPQTGFIKKRQFAKKFEGQEVYREAQERLAFPGHLKFSAPMSAILLGMTNLQSAPLSPVSVRRLMQHFAHGLFDFPGGIDGFKRMLVDRILNNSGQYWADRRLESISIRRNRVKELTVQRPHRTLQARVLICNTSPRNFFGLIPSEQQHQNFHGQLKALQPAYYKYVVNFVVPRRIIPQPMGRHVMVVPYPKQELVGANGIWVAVSHLPEDPEGAAVLTVQARLPYRGLPTDVAGFDRLNGEIQHSLEWLLPFLRENLIAVDTPYVTKNPDTGEDRPDPTAHLEIYDEGFPGTLDLSPIPGKTAYKNILLLGSHYLSGLGLEGQFLGAQQAFKWIRKNIVLKQILRK